MKEPEIRGEEKLPGAGAGSGGSSWCERPGQAGAAGGHIYARAQEIDLEN